MDLKEKFLIIFFITFISLPLFGLIFNVQDGLYNTEKRNMESFPKFKTPIQFYCDFLEYYEDNFGFRYSLMKFASNLKIKLFKTYPRNIDIKVLRGKDGWLFYKLGNEIEDFQGKVPLSSFAINKIKSDYETNSCYLNKLGIKFYVLIPPDKSVIYSEYLPASIISGIKSNKTRISQFLDTDFIYPKKLIINNKEKDGELLYFKTDTHWTYYGAYFGYKVLENKIKQNFNINQLKLSDMKKIEYMHEKPDLADIINIGEKNYEKSYKYLCVEGNKFQKSNLKILIFGDSFLKYLEPYFTCAFYKVKFVSSSRFDKKLIEEFNPDVVIFEIVQRNLRHLFN